MDPFLAFIEHSALAEWVRGSESLLAFPGTTIVMGIFIIAPSIAYAMPAFPELESRTTCPLPIFRSINASSSMRRTGLSLRLPPGLAYSAFANI